MLKEIKTRYAAQCAKCNRDIREGWTVYFKPETKKVYCKPCGKPMADKEAAEGEQTGESKDKSGGMKLLEDLFAQSLLHGELLAKLEEQIRDLIKDISGLDNYIRQAKEASKKAAKK